MIKMVRLVDEAGSTKVQIDVEITDEGDLLFSGYDIGQAPQEIFGDSDYEYWLRIKAADKDQLLLALIEKIYSGNNRVISEFQEYLKANKIPNEFTSF
jgi:hypothetical protein